MTKAKSLQTIIRPHKGGRTVRIVGHVTPDIADKLEALKKQNGLSNGDFLTQSIEQWEARITHKAPPSKT